MVLSLTAQELEATASDPSGQEHKAIDPDMSVQDHEVIAPDLTVKEFEGAYWNIEADVPTEMAPMCQHKWHQVGLSLPG